MSGQAGPAPAAGPAFRWLGDRDSARNFDEGIAGVRQKGVLRALAAGCSPLSPRAPNRRPAAPAQGPVSWPSSPAPGRLAQDRCSFWWGAPRKGRSARGPMVFCRLDAAPACPRRFRCCSARDPMLRTTLYCWRWRFTGLPRRPGRLNRQG